MGEIQFSIGKNKEGHMISNPKIRGGASKIFRVQKLGKCKAGRGMGHWEGGGDDRRKKASNFNCSFLPVCLLSAWLAVVEAEVGHGGVRTRRKDIRATRAQPCITTVPERSYVMDQQSAPRSEGPRI